MTDAEALVQDVRGHLECAICLSAFRVPVTLPRCGHTFCSTCLGRFWASKTTVARNCPTCRAEHMKEMPQVNIAIQSIVGACTTGAAPRAVRPGAREPDWRRQFVNRGRTFKARKSPPGVLTSVGLEHCAHAQWIDQTDGQSVAVVRVFPSDTRPIDADVLMRFGFSKTPTGLFEWRLRSYRDADALDLVRGFVDHAWLHTDAFFLDGRLSPRHCFLQWTGEDGERQCMCEPTLTCKYCTFACCSSEYI